MLILLTVTGSIWLLDYFVLRHNRTKEDDEPWWVEYPKSFFPVILIVFCLRSFLVEPFKIPSGSMIPTLLVGDFILVNKYTYGIRLPVINLKVFDMNKPERGEVMVFRYPEDPSKDYIKRIVGLPGDLITYRNKRLTINGSPVKMKPTGEYTYVESGINYVYSRGYIESMKGHNHTIIINTTIILGLPVRYLLGTISQWEITVIVVVIAVTGDLFLSVI
jgi:signal peptidase I